MRQHHTLASIALLALTVNSANAGLIVNEPFLTGSTPAAGEYSVGSINGQNPTIAGTTGAWVEQCCGSSSVNASGLVYTDPLYFPASSGGKVISTAGDFDNMRNGRVLSSGYSNTSTDTVYLSLLIQLSGTDHGAYRGFELHNGTFNDGDRKLQMGVHSGVFGSSTNFGVKLFNSNSFLQTLNSINESVNLFVLKFNFSNVNNGDSLTVWQNPSLSSGPDPSGGVTLSNFNLELDRFAFGRFASGPGSIAWDELRLGDSWAAVVPEPSSLTLYSIGAAAVAVRRRRRGNTLAYWPLAQ